MANLKICESCGFYSTHGYLHRHHINGRGKQCKEIITLCNRCHILIHNGTPKKEMYKDESRKYYAEHPPQPSEEILKLRELINKNTQFYKEIRQRNRAKLITKMENPKREIWELWGEH